jgi:hypothetical protein
VSVLQVQSYKFEHWGLQKGKKKRCGGERAGDVLALQEQSPEFKTQSHRLVVEFIQVVEYLPSSQYHQKTNKPKKP